MASYITFARIGKRGRSTSEGSYDAKSSLFNFNFNYKRKRDSTSRKSNAANGGRETAENGASTSTGEPDAIGNAVTEREEVPTTSSVQGRGLRRSSRLKSAENDEPLGRISSGQEQLQVSSTKKGKISPGKSLKSNQSQGQESPLMQLGQHGQSSVRRASEVKEDRGPVENEVSVDEFEAVAGGVAKPENGSGGSAKRYALRRSSRKKNAENGEPMKRNSGQAQLPVPSAKKVKVNHGQSLKSNQSQGQEPPLRPMGQREVDVERGRKPVENADEVSDNEGDAIDGAMAELEDASERSAKRSAQPRYVGLEINNDGNSSGIQIAAQVSPPENRVALSDMQSESQVTSEQNCQVSTSYRGTTPEIIETSDDGDENEDSGDDDTSTGQSGDELLRVYIHEKPEEYFTLENAKKTYNLILVDDSVAQNVAGFMKPSFEEAESDENFPGVQQTLPHKLNESFGIGYLKIAPQTVKPPARYDLGKLIFWIIKGAVTVKSAGGRYSSQLAPDEQYLFGMKLEAGACVVIPKNTVYMFENWGTTEALLSYSLIHDEDESNV